MSHYHDYVMQCCIRGCNSTTMTKTSWRRQWCKTHRVEHCADICTCLPHKWFPFPKAKAAHAKWVKLINCENWKPKKSQLICQKHFKDGRPTRKHPNPTQKLGYELPEEDDAPMTTPTRSSRKRKPANLDPDFVFDHPKKRPRRASPRASDTPAKNILRKILEDSMVDNTATKKPTSKRTDSPAEKIPKTVLEEKTPTPVNLGSPSPILGDGELEANEEVTNNVRKPQNVSVSVFYSDPNPEPIRIFHTSQKTSSEPLLEKQVTCRGCHYRNQEIKRLLNKIETLQKERDHWQQQLAGTSDQTAGANNASEMAALGDSDTDPSTPKNHAAPIVIEPQLDEAPIVMAPTLDGESVPIVTEKLAVNLEESFDEADDDNDFDNAHNEEVDFFDFMETNTAFDSLANEPWKSCIKVCHSTKLKAEIAWDFLCNQSALMPVSMPPYQPDGGTLYLWSKTEAIHQDVEEVGEWYNDGYKWRNNGTRIVMTKDGKQMMKRHYKLYSGTKGFMRYAYMIRGKEDPVLVHYVGNSSVYVPTQDDLRKHRITRRIDPDRDIPKMGPLPKVDSPPADLPEGSRMLDVIESRNEEGLLEYVVLQDQPPDPPVHPLPSPYMEGINEPLTTTEVMNILIKPDQSKVCVYPPHRPKAGNAYLWSQDAGANPEDWSVDGYNWQTLSVTSPMVQHPVVTVVERQFFKPLSGVSGFVRYAYNILGSNNLVFIHYVGDEKCYRDALGLQESGQLPTKVLKMVETLHPSGEVEFFLNQPTPDSEAMPYFRYNGPITMGEAVDFLKDPDMTRVTSILPHKPSGGCFYMWSDGGNPNLRDDWRCDGYPWKSNGRRNFHGNGEMLIKHYFKLSGKEKGFTKAAYHLPNNESLVLIEYLGDPSVYVPRRHGNCKTQTKEHVRCPPSLIRQMQVMCEEVGPKATCAELSEKKSSGEPVALRNRHQVYSHYGSIQRKRNKEFSKAVAAVAAAATAGNEGNAPVMIEAEALKSILGDTHVVWENLDPSSVKFEFVTEVESETI